VPRALRAVARATFEDLEAGLDERPPVDDRLVHSLPVACIQPSPCNPRRRLDAIHELADSLRAHGLLQPIVVRRHGPGYELVAGHRRLEAAKQAGWTEIAAVVRDEPDNQAYILTLVENLQREDLTPKEEAAALEVLIRERGWSTRQVGQAIKRSPVYVSRRLRVFEDEILAPLVLQNELSVSTAEELLRADPVMRRPLADQAARERWERPQVRAALARCNAALQPAERGPFPSCDVLAVAVRDEISEAWRLMHKWRARGGAHQAAGDAACIWQANAQAHELERRLRALLRVRQRARRLARDPR
jgi:ParB family transcriptional regulator, chromosome partitioning protein